MAGLSLKHIDKIYPSGVQAVFDFTLDIRDKEFIVLVGPSGCGKSTTLRMIAGLEEISEGTLEIDGVVVNDVVPKDRDIAMVFQNYALYPHMTVYDNMAFGLKLRKVQRDEIDRKVRAAAEILGITDYLTRKPKALSGGQRQRVALGRTIVREPKVFLLDEPLSNLDAKLRASMRTEISKLHTRLATTFIYVTHDQIEAMTMGTRIVVMKDGFMQQVDTPQNLYDYPINLFVAGFIGTPQMNFFKNSTLTSENGKVYVNIIGNNKILLPEAVVARFTNIADYLDTGKTLTLGVRPEDIYASESFVTSSPETTIDVRIEVVEKLGAETQVYCELQYEEKESSLVDTASQMIARISNRSIVSVGDIVKLAFDGAHLHIFDSVTEMSLLERDAGYEVIEENAEGAAFVPPTPQEMAERIAVARSQTKEMKALERKEKFKSTFSSLVKKKEESSEEAPEETLEEAPEEAPETEENESEDQE